MIMYMIVPMTDREKRLKKFKELQRNQAKSNMFDEDGLFKTSPRRDFNYLLGSIDRGAYAKIYDAEVLTVPKTTTKMVRV